MRRGALPLAFVIWLLATYMMVPFMMMIAFAGGFGDPEVWVGVSAVPIFLLAAFLHVRTMRRLGRLAGAE